MSSGTLDEPKTFKTKPHHELRWQFNTYLDHLFHSFDETGVIGFEAQHAFTRKLIQEDTTKEAVARLIESIDEMPSHHRFFMNPPGEQAPPSPEPGH